MRIISLIALFILTSCIHDNGGSERGPLFPSSRKATKSQTNNDASIENPASARLPNKIDQFEEFSIEPDGTIKFTADLVYFAYDNNSLTDKAMIQLQALATYLEKNPQLNIRIDGHADERGSTEYNMALGLQRGASVKKYMKQLGIVEGRLALITFGEEIPVDFDHNESAWSQNRRVEFKLKSH
jgi:peptidoglycan-associated lipoprotein